MHPQGWIVQTLMYNTRALTTLNKIEFTGKKHQANTSLSHELSSFFELLESSQAFEPGLHGSS